MATATVAVRKHTAWVAEYAAFDAQKPWPVISYKEKLNAARLSEHFSCGAFTKLLILSDFADAFGAGFVHFPRDFGPGVRVGGMLFDAPVCADLAKSLNANRTFREHFGGSCKSHHVGHLICELRQACFRGFTDSAASRLLAHMDRHYSATPGADRFSEAARRLRAEKRELCHALAAFTS